jgi:hypothetical protein
MLAIPALNLASRTTRVVRLVWGAALVLAAGCGEEFVAGGGMAGGAGMSNEGGQGGSASHGGSSRGGGAQAGGHAGSAGRGGSSAASGSGGGGGGVVPSSGTGNGDAGAAGGAAVEVPPIPVDGLELWFDASRGVGQVGGVVSQWADQSGHGRNALQTSTNLRPKLVDNALAGKPALVFDGDENAGDYLRLPTLEVDFAKGVSIFVAAEQTSAAGDTPCEGFFEASNGSEVDDIHLGTWQKSLIFEVALLYVNDTSFPLLFDQPQLVGAVLDPSRTVQVRRNSNAVGSGQADLPALTGRTQVFLGHSLYAECKPLHGVIGEVILYSRAVTDPEVLQIESYLQQRWGCCTE